MSLSTQLARGLLALPLLLLFAGLGVVSSNQREPSSVLVERVQALSQLCSTAPTRHVLVLAQAPADLGQLAIRWSQPCRA